MKKTDNYGLTLYEKTDNMSISAEENSLNANIKIIDEVLLSKAEKDNIPKKISELDNDKEFITNKELEDKGYLTEVPNTYKTKSENDGLYQSKGDYANKRDIPSKVSELENDSKYISSIPLEYVTESELSGKGYATESFVTNKIAEAELSGGEVDLSGLATKDELSNKVDKEKGKSLIADGEITRLASVSNYDDTEIKETLKSKADISDIPTKVSELTNDEGYITSIPSDYKTKAENDNLYQTKGNYLTSYTESDPTVPSHVKNITTTDISNWDNKSTFSGNYNDLTNKPTIPVVPTNISAFNNDKGYLTKHQDISGKADKTELPTKTSQLTNDSNFITSIPSEYITETELNNKGYLTSVPNTYKTKTENDALYQAKGNYLTSYIETDPTVPAWAKATTKPSYTKSEVGLGNVDNVKQYSSSNPPPYPVTSVNGKTGAVTVSVPTNTSQLTNDSGFITQVSEEEKQEIIDEVVSSMSYVEPKNIPYTVTKSCVQSATGKIGTTSDHMRTDYIPLTGYDTIKYVGKCANSKMAIGFFDDAQQPMLSEGVVGHGTSIKEVIKTIPQGAAYAVCSVYVGSDTSTEWVVDVYYSKSNPTAEAIEGLKSSNYSFEGKKVMFFGDSITYDANMYRKNLLEKTKMVEVACFALNGATMRNHSDTVMDGNPVALQHSNTIPNQVQKLLNNSSSYDTPDIVIISAATNDSSAETGYDETQYTDESGAYIGLDTVNIKTFSGAMRWAYEKIISLYPNTKIFFATPIQCGDKSTRTFTSLKTKAECIRQNCERLSTPCIDAFKRSGIYGRYDESGVNGKYLKDGLHPNANGAKVLAKCYHRELANALID